MSLQNMTPKKAKKTGRPSAYRTEYAAQAGALTHDGATDEQLAAKFSVTVGTIQNWKKSEPEFLYALKAGKREADSEVVTSLFKRAQGFEYEEAVPIKLKTVTYNEKGVRASEVERVEIVMVARVVPPDTTACIFWLKNRQQAAWRDKQEHDVTSGGQPLVVRFVREGK